MNLVVVTASTDPERAKPCIRSWGGMSFVGVVNGRPCTPQPKPEGEAEGELVRSWLLSPEYLGTVPAFRLGVDYALEHTDAEIIACFHDDVEILDPEWQQKVTRLFERHPACGLAGFSGAIGLGDADLYTTPYNPMHLARIGFRSNLVDAEVHGIRSLLSEQVAVADGFSQIGRREFFEGLRRDSGREGDKPWTLMEDLGVRHHCYDAMLGCCAKRLGWETWYLPISCRHYGGQTAVGDREYQAWAKKQVPGGDQGFWQAAHKICYDTFNDVLPLRV